MYRMREHLQYICIGRVHVHVCIRMYYIQCTYMYRMREHLQCICIGRVHVHVCKCTMYNVHTCIG